MTKFDRILAPGVVLGVTALGVHIYAGLAPRIDVDCKGVQAIPACGCEKDVPGAPPLASIAVAAVSTGTMLVPMYVTFDTTTDEARVAPAVVLSYWDKA